jgi:hypothetical protein
VGAPRPAPPSPHARTRTDPPEDSGTVQWITSANGRAFDGQGFARPDSTA